jgi:hypothetical protein
MAPPASSSLTGSACGAPSTHNPYVCCALGRLRFGVNLCCWIVSLALLAQVVVWALVSFTDMRFAAIAAPSRTPLIVNPVQEETIADAPSAFDAPNAIDKKPKPAPAGDPVDANRVPGRNDRILSIVAALASGFGALAVIALTPLIGLGVLLAASSATEGVERTVSAFGWSLVVGLLVLPIGDVFGMPWRDGALWSYAHLVEQVDARHVADGLTGLAAAGGIVAVARYVVMPITCLVGIALVAQRFNAGIRAGTFQKEDFALDPALEVEAANVKPGSNHGSRAAAAMRSALNSDDDRPAEKLSRRTVSQGSVPKRLI